MENKLENLIQEMRVAFKRYSKTNAEIGDYSKALEYQAKAEILGELCLYIITNKVDSMLDYLTTENKIYKE